MSHENKDYIQILRSQGHKVTPQRLIVLDAVCALEGHATIADIQAKVHFLDPSINRSTIYRALEVLTEVGLVTEAEMAEGKIYRIAGEAEHHHLTCTSCGRILTIPKAALSGFIADIQRDYSFVIAADHLVLKGTCEACRQPGIDSHSTPEKILDT
jgi:Fur family transcriptional regulator, ferric uptake regulator